MERPHTSSQGQSTPAPEAPARLSDDTDSLDPSCLTPDIDPPPPSDRADAIRAVRAVRAVVPPVVGPEDAATAPVETSGGRSDEPPAGAPQIPGYDVLHEVGRGGMGVVYQARQHSLNRLVALKVILAGPHAGAEARVRFRAEAELAAGLQHPNIVQVFEVGDHQGLLYLAAEYLAGGNLAEYLAQNAFLPPDLAAGLVETLARAVHTAHEQGIVHRDLKPANILLQRGSSAGSGPTVLSGNAEPGTVTLGTPKIADFGLAKRLDDPGGLTAAGTVVGTPYYMAPEQAGGGAAFIGPATDVYALGALLYETLAGRPPFKGASVLETLEQVRTLEPIPPGRLRPRLPRDLETICLKCLAKDARRRYASAADLAEDLRRFLAAEPILARPVPAWERTWKWVRRRPALAGLLGVVALAIVFAFAGVLWHHARLQEQVQRAQAEEQKANHRYQEAREAIRRMLARLDDRRLAEVPRLQELYEGQLVDALTFYQGVLDEGGPPDSAAQFDVALAYQRAGLIQWRLSHLKEARRSFLKAARLLEDLSTHEPDKLAYSANLAVCYEGLHFNLVPGADSAEQLARWTTQALALRKRVAQAEPDNPVYQNALAESYHNRAGAEKTPAGRRQAMDAYEKAMTLREQLWSRFPDQPVYAYDAAADGLALGLVYAAVGKLDQAEAVYQKAAALLQGAIRVKPQQPDYQSALAALYTNWAMLARDYRHDSAKATRLATRGIDLAEAVLRKEPLHAQTRIFCASAHGNRANCNDDLGHYADAARDWERMIELSKGPAQYVPRTFHARSLVRAGDYVRAMDDVGRLVADPNAPVRILEELAGIAGTAMSAAQKDKKLDSEQRTARLAAYAKVALACLRQALARGVFRKPWARRELEQDNRLAPLHGRADFKELLREIKHSPMTPGK